MCTHTHTAMMMTSGIPDLAEIVEVDNVGRNPETPQHDGMQRW
jgi:hypothetical protein